MLLQSYTFPFPVKPFLKNRNKKLTNVFFLKLTIYCIILVGHCRCSVEEVRMIPEALGVYVYYFIVLLSVYHHCNITSHWWNSLSTLAFHIWWNSPSLKFDPSHVNNVTGKINLYIFLRRDLLSLSSYQSHYSCKHFGHHVLHLFSFVPIVVDYGSYCTPFLWRLKMERATWHSQPYVISFTIFLYVKNVESIFLKCVPGNYC